MSKERKKFGEVFCCFDDHNQINWDEHLTDGEAAHIKSKRKRREGALEATKNTRKLLPRHCKRNSGTAAL